MPGAKKNSREPPKKVLAVCPTGTTPFRLRTSGELWNASLNGNMLEKMEKNYGNAALKWIFSIDDDKNLRRRKSIAKMHLMDPKPTKKKGKPDSPDKVEWQEQLCDMACLETPKGWNKPNLKSAKRICKSLFKAKKVILPRRTVSTWLREGCNRGKRRPVPAGRHETEEKRIWFAQDVLQSGNVSEDYSFIDETMLELDVRIGVQVRTRKGAPGPKPRPTVHTVPKIHLFGGIAQNRRFLMMMPGGTKTETMTGTDDRGKKVKCTKEVKCNATGVVYRDHVLKPFAELGWGKIIVQDGAPIHNCALRLLGEDGHNVLLGWPGYSPDLNPIENLWNWVKDKFDDLCMERNVTQAEAWEEIQKIWDDVPQDFINKLVSGWFDRLRKCVDLNGGRVQN